MPTPTYRIIGSNVQRENVPEEWLARARPQLGIDVQQEPSLKALRELQWIGAPEGTPSIDEWVTAQSQKIAQETPAAQEASEQTIANQLFQERARREAPSLSAAPSSLPPSVGSKIVSGIGRGLSSLAEQPLIRALETPQGAVMSSVLSGPIRAIRLAEKYGFGPALGTIRRAATNPSAASLRSLRSVANQTPYKPRTTATYWRDLNRAEIAAREIAQGASATSAARQAAGRSDKYTRTLRALQQESPELTRQAQKRLAKKEGLPYPESLLSRRRRAQDLELARFLASE